MKYFLAVLLIVAVVQAENWAPKSREQIKSIHEECVAENSVSADNIAKMKHLEYPDEESVRKYIQCCAQKMGLFCTHEGYHTDRLTEQFKGDLPADEVRAIMDGCVDKNEQGSPADVWAYRCHKCFMESKVGQKAKEYIRNRVVA